MKHGMNLATRAEFSDLYSCQCLPWAVERTYSKLCVVQCGMGKQCDGDDSVMTLSRASSSSGRMHSTWSQVVMRVRLLSGGAGIIGGGCKATCQTELEECFLFNGFTCGVVMEDVSTCTYCMYRYLAARQWCLPQTCSVPAARSYEVIFVFDVKHSLTPSTTKSATLCTYCALYHSAESID
jgi:hypothetical protein